MRSDFVQLLERLLNEHYRGKQREFIRVAQPNDEEASAQGYLSRVLAGKRPPPMEHVEAWGRALQLRGYGLERFLDLAAIAHLPPEVQHRFVQMLDREAESDRRIKSLERRVAELREKYDA